MRPAGPLSQLLFLNHRQHILGPGVLNVVAVHLSRPIDALRPDGKSLTPGRAARSRSLRRCCLTRRVLATDRGCPIMVTSVDGGTGFSRKVVAPVVRLRGVKGSCGISIGTGHSANLYSQSRSWGFSRMETGKTDLATVGPPIQSVSLNWLLQPT